MAIDEPLRVKANNRRLLLIEVLRRIDSRTVIAYPLTDCVVQLFVKASARAVDPAPIAGTITDVDLGLAQAEFDTGPPGTKWRRIDVYRPDSDQRVTVDAGPLIVEPA